MKFEDYRRAAIGDLAYIENLLLPNPDLIDELYDGLDHSNDSFLMQALSTYSSLELGHYYRLIGTRVSDWGHYLLGRSFDTQTHFMRTLLWTIRPSIMVGELIFISTELAATLAVYNQKRYLKEHKGWSLLDFAVENGQSDVAVFLILKGANTKRITDIAKANGHGIKFSILLNQALLARAKEKTLEGDIKIALKNLEEALELVEMSGEKQITLGIDNYWYADEDVNTLLKSYFPITQSDIRALPALEWNENNSDIHMFIQTRFTNAIGYHPDCFVYFLPLQINKNHWVGLYVDRTPQNECIWWIDPISGITEEWKTQIVNILNAAQLFENNINITHINYLADRLQNDGFNCGPWVVELLRFFAANKRLPVAEEIDIGAKRQEHLTILIPSQSPKTLELQGASEKLDGFGVFGGQGLVAVIGKNTQNNRTLQARL